MPSDKDVTQFLNNSVPANISAAERLVSHKTVDVCEHGILHVKVTSWPLRNLRNSGAGKRIFFITDAHFVTGTFPTNFNRRQMQSERRFTNQSNERKSQRFKTFCTDLRLPPPIVTYFNYRSM